jgi:hypothetical protein
MKSNQRIHGLIQSGLIYSLVNFVTGLGNMLFSSVLVRHLQAAGQYSDANSANNGFIPLLSLMPSIALFAVTHYIAHFKALGDEARLQGLIAGCRKFLIYLTIGGSVLAVVVIKPLSDFFQYSQSMMVVTLGCVVLTLWSSLTAALCQGLSWFKRLALIGFLTMAIKFGVGYVLILRWPSPETAVLAATLALFANLVVFIWRKELRISARPVSPWNREFVHYLVISTACVLGGYFFMRGDLLVAKRFFVKADNDAYNIAELLATSLPITAAPLLTVLFTSRSSTRSGNIVSEQFKLLGLYVFALLFGGVTLFVLRHLLIRFMAGHAIAAAADMILPFGLTMVFVGLLQAIAFWALSSRWHKVSLLYGALGLLYWLILFAFGHTPAMLLTVMPITAGTAFLIMFVGWYVSMRNRQVAAAQS